MGKKSILKGIHRDGGYNLIFSDQGERPTADYFYSAEILDCAQVPQYQLILFTKPASYRKLPISKNEPHFLDGISSKDSDWLNDSITKVAIEANYKHKKMWEILRGNPFQPSLSHPHRHFSFFLNSLFELGSELEPEGYPQSTAWIIFYHGCGISTAVFFIGVFLWLTVFDLTCPISIYIQWIKAHHVVSSEETQWFKTVFENPDNTHLCGNNVEISILSRLNDIAAELTKRTGKQYRAAKNTYSYTVTNTNSDGNGTNSFTVVRDSFEIVSSSENMQIMDRYEV